MTNLETIAICTGELTESPLWCGRASALYWVSCAEGRVWRRNADGDVSVVQLGSRVGSMGLAADGRMLVAADNRLLLLEDSGRTETLALIELPASVRLNDGKVGPDGRFWVGGMDGRDPKQPVAALHSIDVQGQVRQHACGLHVSNGLAWSPDGRWMYHSDSYIGVIWRYAFEAGTGRLGDPERWIVCEPGWGRPDGAAVDAQGCYWSAGIGAGRLNRFSPEGRLIEHMDLPISRPTMVAFGGSDLRTLYITSMRARIPPEQLAGEPLAGSVFALRAPVAGLPPTLFGPGLPGR